MSETLREAWDTMCANHRETWQALACRLIETYGDALVIRPAGPDAKPCIVTMKAVDRACAHQIGCEGAKPSDWNEMPESEKDAWRFKFVLGLTGLGPFESELEQAESDFEDLRGEIDKLHERIAELEATSDE